MVDSLDWQRFDLCEDCFLLTAKLPKELCLRSAEFAQLWNAQPKERGTVMMRGSLVTTPRKQQAYEVPYWFSGILHQPNDRYPTPEYAKRLQSWLQSQQFSWPFSEYDFEPNEVLINWYANGHDYIGAHSDDERQMHLTEQGCALVVTASFGAVRKFRFRDKQTNAIVRDFELDNNTLCVMGGLTQRKLKHEIVKISGQRGLATLPRISITLRHFVDK